MASARAAPGFFGPLLLARDFERTLRFYRDLLSLPVEGAHPYAKCISTPSTFSVVDGRWWGQVNGSENPIQGESSVADSVLMIQVDDVRQVFERLMGAGVVFLSVPVTKPEMGVWSVFLRDPDGRSVVLTSPLD
ncbi:MAG: VOC family protein [Thermoplasmata archaeon]|nr:VOC family protein [Thermoplasmata archaeon]